jgi:hypothetical protein
MNPALLRLTTVLSASARLASFNFATASEQINLEN